MFNFIKNLGKATNVERFSNHTDLIIGIDITTSEGKKYEGNLAPKGECVIDIKRDTIGDITGHLTVKYSTGAVWILDFGVAANNCTDYIDIHKDQILYNRGVRGSMIVPHQEKLIDLLDLDDIKVSGLKTIAKSKSIDISGAQTRADLLDLLS